MKKFILAFTVASVFTWLITAPSGFSQTKFTTEEHFHDLFITAGYSTAFGAALGAAFIGLSEYPEENLKYIAMGASFGFITGSFLGTYIIFSPILSFDHAAQLGKETHLSSNLLQKKPSQLTLQPILNLRQKALAGIKANWTILTF